MSSQLAAPRPLYGWAQPTVATDWTADTVLGADIAFVRAERLPLPPPRRGTSYRPLAPDLVVEIASPSQDQPEIGEKARLWLDRGVRQVWVVWPERRAIDIWTAGAAAPHTPRDAASLDGGDIVPGFRLPLAEIW
ncbi:MAG TPA: Uma2 family endonuclease [Chloroflexota bacterium]|nr:Uma2 family endonuclease [Chloroflexota bacterium]